MNLIPMKKSRKNPTLGDVFVLQVDEDIYYYGKVVMEAIDCPDRFMKGMWMISIYDYGSNSKEIPDNLSEYELLIAPIVVNKQPWVKGYFQTIGKMEVTDKELSIDYGFWNVLKDEYVDLQGNKLDRIPKYVAIYGLGSYGIVDKEVHKALENKFEESMRSELNKLLKR